MIVFYRLRIPGKPTPTRGNQRSQTEVCDLDDAVVDQNVLWLQIAMDDILGVEISQSLKQLSITRLPRASTCLK